MTTKNWSRNKIIGSIAETCVEQHFEQLGYKVEKTGIEHIAPFYADLEVKYKSKDNWGNYSQDIRMNYRGLPDFLISRVHPNIDEISDEIKFTGSCGKAEVLFVEAKFRSNTDLDELQKEFQDQYSEETMIYLVVNGWKYPSKDKSGNDVCVFMNWLKKPNWWKAGDSDFEKYLFYAGTNKDINFNSINKDTIRPALDEIFRGYETVYVD